MVNSLALIPVPIYYCHHTCTRHGTRTQGCFCSNIKGVQCKLTTKCYLEKTKKCRITTQPPTSTSLIRKHQICPAITEFDCCNGLTVLVIKSKTCATQMVCPQFVRGKQKTFYSALSCVRLGAHKLIRRRTQLLAFIESVKLKSGFIMFNLRCTVFVICSPFYRHYVQRKVVECNS